MCSNLIMDGTEVVQSTSTKSAVSPCNTTSPLSSPSCTAHNSGTSLEDGEDDGDISVGCPSPAPSCPQQVDTSSSSSSSCFSSARTTVAEQDTHSEETVDEDEYFKPLKKLKMMQINKVAVALTTNHKQSKTNVTVAPLPASRHINSNQSTGVKSFSILDILNHRPRTNTNDRAVCESNSARIVRPWDLNTSNGVSSPSLHPRPKSADLCYASETLSSTCSSGRSSTAGSIASDCCTSPDIINCTITSSPTTSAAQVRHHAAVVSQHHRHFSSAQRAASSGKGSSASGGGKTPNTSPLDALFQMTSKTFEELNGEAVSEVQPRHFHRRENLRAHWLHRPF
ncbi:putative GPI-anchored protein pfl2 [Zootermopsis nevadensis]|uniref:putative GPI-anchored protein pfl2 n=1 Tax=Zootermopsis nevadensis TaxID=136037 RepID=UPI000B8EB8EF|nr:putative GPI-anchored protein pfl2 [Zootermopsis nevadensis]